MYKNEIEIYILPETAKCCADTEERSIYDIDKCPVGERFCNGDCYYYTE